ncbi:MAG: cytochrome c1 [Rhodobacteraceae bacterium]|nr:cytochrome c1 [Paracoccaceae bacterium]
MLRKTLLSGLAALGLVAAAAAPSMAAEGGHIHDYSFSFEGPFGTYDQAQLQRGLQVYTEVCSACHGLKFVAFRTLADPGGPAIAEDQMRAYAAQWDVFDPELDDLRPGTPPDHFPPSQNAAAPDLSLMAKARAGFHGPLGLGINQMLRGIGGPEYIVGILTGFTGEEMEQAGTVLYENSAFGGYMGMSPVLMGDDVTYADGTPATVEQEAQDVAAFLMWSAEPKMMARKTAGMTAVLFLVVLTVLLYLTNKKLWLPYKGKKKHS